MSFDFDALIQAIVEFFKLLKEFLNKLKGIPNTDETETTAEAS
ncbi:MAG TPA: hypothetical protein PKY39_04495 [Clostridiales bacterium]|nr:hypothetical protein [Clostridiales bacterium]